nr:BAG family molecular chaperone regulator 7 [Tanacetum cinerariifolium]
AFDRALKEELSPQDAAMVIQITFREYLVRSSQSLRELAVAKGKLKELRGLFNNFSYRRKLARDAEERHKVIVLLLTVDAIEVKCITQKL